MALDYILNHMNTATADSVIRYVLTNVHSNGMRTLLDPQQGRYTYATQAEAEIALCQLLENNDEKSVWEFYGDPKLIQVRSCECWTEHFDPKGIWFDD